MRPSVQLPRVSVVDSKLRLTMVRSSLQSAPEPPVVDPPPVGKHVCMPDMRQFLEVFGVRWPWPLTFDGWPFQLKIALHLLEPWGTFIPVLIFLRFSSYEPVKDRRTAGQTGERTYIRLDKTRNAAYGTASYLAIHFVVTLVHPHFLKMFYTVVIFMLRVILLTFVAWRCSSYATPKQSCSTSCRLLICCTVPKL